jgi:hypothetical protein
MILKLKSINNSRFAEFLPLIYPTELEVKETTDTASSASFLDLYLEFNDNIHILCLSCNIKKSEKTAKLSEKS